ncbi:MAG: DNA repair protein RecN, partial [Atribacterota bacterium]|nr:DNA repair protein RecN [Atribacterota bacterium]
GKAKKFLLNNLSKNRAENLSKKDFLLFQLQEIDDAKLIEKEDEELENKINIIHNTVKIKEIMEMAYLALYEGNEEGEASVRDTIVRLINNFNIITRLDIEIANIKNDLLEVQFKIEDIADKVIEYKEKLDFDAQQLQEFENRIDLINHLKKKYGSDIKEILEKRDFLQNQLDNIEDNQKKMEVLKNEIKEDEKNLTILSLYLSEQRKIIAEKLANDIIKELNELNMKNCSFDIKINQQEDSNGININNKLIKINSNGIDQVEFFIATNVGEQKKPLAEIVSGGEASRIMLGLKSILGKVDEVPTMIFDEIDSGVGARLGEIIATKLKKISRNHQIITVTHLPQIACRANRHLYINKYIDKTKTNIQLKILKGKEQLEEIARMIDGEQYGFISLEHAREMLYGKDFLKDEK